MINSNSEFNIQLNEQLSMRVNSKDLQTCKVSPIWDSPETTPKTRTLMQIVDLGTAREHWQGKGELRTGREGAQERMFIGYVTSMDNWDSILLKNCRKQNTHHNYLCQGVKKLIHHWLRASPVYEP